MAIFTFTNPKYLAIILIIPALIFIHFYSLKRHDMRALKFANFDAISRISGIQFFSKNLTVLYLSIILVAIMSLASAGMHMSVTKSASTFSFVIAIDTSQSMETTDLSPSRIEAAKTAATEFVNNAPVSTRIGVMSFSGVPFIEQEITANKEPMREAIRNIRVNRVGGTNIMNAMIAASTMYKEEDTKAIIVLSDGEINVDTVEAIIKYAKQNEIVINTLGVGTTKGAENILGYVSKLDEEALKAMAYETAGQFSLVNNNEELKASMLEMLKLSRRKVNLDMTYPLFFISTIMFIIIFVLINFKYSGIP
ncbi:MAG: VWA domain-containing protein [Nanoarchaeota archaeon]